MASDNIQFNVKHYTDIQGLTSLKGKLKNNTHLARKEVAQQFESLMVQMMLKSMRSANKAFTDGEGHSDAFDIYQDLFDKQISLSTSGLGLAKQIESYLKRISPEPAEENSDSGSINDQIRLKPEATVQKSPHTEKQSGTNPLFNSSSEFVQKLWSFAKSAADKLGLNPKVLLAQAALETSWGKSIVSHPEKGTTYNLFNIKADQGWHKNRTETYTLEEKDGIFKKEKAAFRAYNSFEESFNDYVHFIKSNPRYTKAREYAHDPVRYLQQLQEANYATDQHYAEKILNIYKKL